MHITQTEASSKIVETGKIGFTRITDALDGKGGFLGSALYKKQAIDIGSDSRVAKLVDTVQREIKDHSWKLPDNEREICEKTVQLIHEKEFFGPYASAIAHDWKQTILTSQQHRRHS